MQMMKKILLLIPPIMALGCNSESSISYKDIHKQNSQSDSQNLKGQMTKGMQYTYFADNSCTEKENKVCITSEMYQKLCKANEGMSKNQAEMLQVKNYKALLTKNPSFEQPQVYWSDSLQNCRAVVTITGFYEGNYISTRVDGLVSSFILNDENKILAH